jgi:hypothetical protein
MELKPSYNPEYRTIINEFIHTRPLNTGLAVLAETVAAASRL